jgi:bacterioferritin-associated ferredoxin
MFVEVTAASPTSARRQACGSEIKAPEASMIICICRRLSDRSLQDTITKGARTPAAVFHAHGCAPQCGSCVPFVRKMIEQTTGSPPLCATPAE